MSKTTIGRRIACRSLLIALRGLAGRLLAGRYEALCWLVVKLSAGRYLFDGLVVKLLAGRYEYELFAVDRRPY